MCQVSTTSGWHQFINFFDIKSPSIYSQNPIFVADCLLVYITFIGTEFIHTETCPPVWFQIVCGLYTNQVYRFSYPAGLWKLVMRVRVFSYNFHIQMTCWIKGNFWRESLVLKVWWTKIVVGIRDKPRVKKDHWIHPLLFSIKPGSNIIYFGREVLVAKGW